MRRGVLVELTDMERPPNDLEAMLEWTSSDRKY
jgi:hypothetical protein